MKEDLQEGVGVHTGKKKKKGGNRLCQNETLFPDKEGPSKRQLAKRKLRWGGKKLREGKRKKNNCAQSTT